MAAHKLGEVLRDSGLMTSLTSEEVEMKCIAVKGVESKFEVRYFGVLMGKAIFVADPSGEYWQWEG